MLHKLISTLIKFGGVGLGFIFLVVVARKTTAEEYGVFAYSFSLATIIGYAAVLGQSVSILRFWPKIDEVSGRKSANAFLSIPVKLTTLSCLCVAILAILCAQAIGSVQGAISVVLMSVAFTLTEITIATLRAQGRVFTALAPREIIWRLLSIAVIWSYPTVMSGNFAITLCALSLIIVSIPQILFTLCSIYKNRDASVPQEILTEHKHASKGLAGISILMPVTQHLTTVIVAMALGPISAAIYFASDRVSKLLTIPMVGANQLAAPVMSRALQRNDLIKVNEVARSSCNFSSVSCFIGFVFLCFFGKYLLQIFNPQFVDGYSVLMILSIGQIFAATSGANEILLQIAKLERQYFFAVAFWGCGSIIASGVSAIYFGMTGAAIASSIGLIGRTIHTVVLCYLKLNVISLPLLKIR